MPEPDSEPRRFVNLPVPEEYVIPVMTYISQLDAGTVPTTDPELDSVPETPAADTSWTVGEVWPTDALRRFAKGAVETTQIVGVVLDALATRPGHWFDLTDLARELDIERDKLKYVWTHLTRHLKKHYPGLVVAAGLRLGRRHPRRWTPHRVLPGDR